MFTGLVREVGTVVSFEAGRLRVGSSIEAAAGDSVAIDGVCLTAVDGDGMTPAFDAPSTWRGSRGYDLRMAAHELQEQGMDTVDANLALGIAADERERGIGNQILADLGLGTIRLLTNYPKKVAGLGAHGLPVTEQVSQSGENLPYLRAKREKLGHRLHHQDVKFEPDAEA
jgi:GTP cyclohydrolase II/lumazine binding protein